MLRRTSTSSGGASPPISLPDHLDAPLLDGSQTTDKRQQRGFARARRTGHDHDLAASNVEAIVEQHLLGQFTVTERMLQIAHSNAQAAGACSVSDDGNSRVASRVGASLVARIGAFMRITPPDRQTELYGW